MAVYFIRAGDVGPVKIGWADDAEVRRQQLQTSHYEPLRLIRVVDGVRRAERWMHDRYATLRQRGEWFRFDSDMMAVAPPDLAGWRPPRRPKAPRQQVDDLPAWRSDFVAYLATGSDALLKPLAEWLCWA